MPQPTPFGKRLRQARDLRGLSQSELAEKAKLPAVMISHFETGVRANAQGFCGLPAWALERSVSTRGSRGSGLQETRERLG